MTSSLDGCLVKILRIDYYHKLYEEYTYEVEIIKAGKPFKWYNIKQLGWKIGDGHTASVDEHHLSKI